MSIDIHARTMGAPIAFGRGAKRQRHVAKRVPTLALWQV